MKKIELVFADKAKVIQEHFMELTTCAKRINQNKCDMLVWKSSLNSFKKSSDTIKKLTATEISKKAEDITSNFLVEMEKLQQSQLSSLEKETMLLEKEAEVFYKKIEALINNAELQREINVCLDEMGEKEIITKLPKTLKELSEEYTLEVVFTALAIPLANRGQEALIKSMITSRGYKQLISENKMLYELFKGIIFVSRKEKERLDIIEILRNHFQRV